MVTRLLKFPSNSDPFALDVHVKHLYFENVPYRDNFTRVFDVHIRQLRNVYERVLMDTDIDERAEVCHIRNGPFEHHTGLEVLHGLNAF